MNGSRYFLDTNAIISLLKGNNVIDKQLHSATWIGTSVICVIEYLSFSSLSPNDRELLNILSQRIHTISIENSYAALEQIAKLCQETKLKLPDAVIAASAIANEATLISNDKHFSSVPNLTVALF